jgi:hypothetical protein
MGVGKYVFELEMIRLLGLPNGVTRFTLNCAYDEPPTVACEYEVQVDGLPRIKNNAIEKAGKKYKIILEEIPEKGKDDP